MWESPIKITEDITRQMDMVIENGIMKAVRKVGIDVDKEELLKALQYDRGQYEKGYQDGVTDTNVGGKWTLCSKKLPEGCDDAELEVLVYTKEKYIEAEFKEVGFALYYPGEKKFRSVYNHRADITENVVAWMYKPESYKGE